MTGAHHALGPDSDGHHSHGDPSGGTAALIHFPDHHHGDDEPEVDSALDVGAADEYWNVENVELTTVGIDIGSSTSHLMFARVHLQRLAQGLSSRFVIVDRQVLWRSPVLLTPYLADNSIDADALDEFVQAAYREAGFARSAIDSGAVVLTGEALKRRNARAIADLFAAEAGRFVTASAGHHLEAVMAAHGSGAVAASRAVEGVRLHVDIGGGTSKIAVLSAGRVLGTAAVAVGGRLVALEGRRVVRLEGPALEMASAAGVRLSLGADLSEADERRLARAFVEVLMGVITSGEVPRPFPQDLLLVDDRPVTTRPESISFSGGVGEYIYGRETDNFGDVAVTLAEELLTELDGGNHGLALAETRHHIRATVIGASQFSVQVSGNTVAVPGTAVLPLRNLPVLFPGVALADEIDAALVARAIDTAALHFDVAEGVDPVAIALRWEGDPDYRRLRALAEGVSSALSAHRAAGHPLVLLLDGDVARSLGQILTRELEVEQPVICLDGVRLEEFDYVDIGEVIHPANVVPLIIKSLLFAAPAEPVHGAGILSPADRAGSASG